jgi:hypothetical protein
MSNISGNAFPDNIFQVDDVTRGTAAFGQPENRGSRVLA